MNSMPSLRIILFITYLLGTVFNVAAEYRIVLQSGHDGATTGIQWHARTRTLLSVGEDGRFIVYNPSMESILHRFRVTNGQILKFQCAPTGNRVALIAMSTEGYTLSVWNWKEEQELYAIALDSEPLFLTWSARGKYLALGKITPPSLLVIDGKNGHIHPYLGNLPYLFNSGYIGSTEQIMMTYTSTGDIRYWNIRDSALKLTVRTLADLTDLTILQTGKKSTIFARKGENLYLINRQSGNILDRLKISGLVDATVDALNGTLDILSESSTGHHLRQFTLSGDIFKTIDEQIPLIPVEFPSTPLHLCTGGGHVYVSTASGSLMRITDGARTTIAEDITWEPQALTFGDNDLYMSGNSTIWRFSSPFFSQDSKISLDALEDYTSRLVSIDTSSDATRLKTLPDGRIIAWTDDAAGVESKISILEFDTTESILSLGSFDPIASLKIIDDSRVMTIDHNGIIKILNHQTGRASVRYSALGILDAAYLVQGNFILAGKSSDHQSHTPLEKIDMSTLESEPIPDGRFMIYRVISGKEAVYTIGIENSSLQEKRTNLLAHSIENPNQSSMLLQLPDEDMNAIIVPQKQGNGVYTNLGGKVRRILKSQTNTYEWNFSIIDLHEYGMILYGIDEEGTLVLWDVNDGSQELIRIVFFKDGSWMARRPDSRTIWISHGAEKSFLLFRDSTPVDPHQSGFFEIISSKDLHL